MISRDEFTRTLNEFWGAYIQRYQALPIPYRQRFLRQQGYPTLAALLGHIIAWWQDGTRVIAQMRADPNLINPGYDVDAFNAAAVMGSAGVSEAQAAEVFEQQRQAMLLLVSELSDAELNDERINTRLFYEIIQHAEEHALPG